MEFTSIYTDINLRVTGYMLNASIDLQNQNIIEELQQKLKSKLGKVVYTPPIETLHITLVNSTSYKLVKKLFFFKVMTTAKFN